MNENETTLTIEQLVCVDCAKHIGAKGRFGYGIIARLYLSPTTTGGGLICEDCYERYYIYEQRFHYPEPVYVWDQVANKPLRHVSQLALLQAENERLRRELETVSAAPKNALETMATELHRMGVELHEQLQQSLEMYPAQIADLHGQSKGYIAASVYIRERIAGLQAPDAGSDDGGQS